jgi:hypothetical protein
MGEKFVITNNNNKKHMSPPRSQDDIPKNIRTCEMGAKFVIPTTTTRRNTCPHPDPKMTSPKNQDL